VSVEDTGKCVVDLMYNYVKHSSVASCGLPELLKLSIKPEVTVLTGEQEMAGWTKKKSKTTDTDAVKDLNGPERRRQG
jgi:hypothetical protein